MIRGRGGYTTTTNVPRAAPAPLLVKLEPLLMEACVVLRAAAALDLGANEYPPHHDSDGKDESTGSDGQATPKTTRLRGSGG